jgi:signal transduction histidine kinase
MRRLAGAVAGACLLAAAPLTAPSAAAGPAPHKPEPARRAAAPRDADAVRQGSPRKPRFVYGGDSHFPPYDYLDPSGRATGFSVELVRALARDAGVDVEIRLGPWNEARADLDAGRVDLLSLSYSDERAGSYAWLARTWTMQQCVLFPPGRPAYPRGPSDLEGETIAVQDRSAVHEMLYGLPEPRPALVSVVTQQEGLALLARGRATGVAGNSLTLRTVAAAAGVSGLVEVPLRSVPYGLWTKRGRQGELAWVARSTARLRADGTVEALAERFLGVPRPDPGWRENAQLAAVLVGLTAALTVAASAWNRSLRRQVRLRTRELEATLAQKEDLARSLAQSEERYRTFLALSSEGIARFELDEPVPVDEPAERQVEALARHGRLVECNHAFARLRDRTSPSELAGLVIADFVPLGEALEQARGFVRHGYRLAERESALPCGGGVRWMSANAVGIVEAGRLLGYWLTARDVSARKELQESLRKSETMSAMGSLVAGVAHEVRNPLFGISATVDVLECGPDEPRGRAEYLGLLRSEVARLSRLMQDLLDYGKPPALTVVPCDITSILDAAIRACAAEAREKEVVVALDVPPEVPALVVDGARMEQVFLNLVANAIHFSPRGGRVRVSASVAAGLDAAVDARVEDEGEGLTPGDIPRLFEPFFTRREGGTGLGLSIVQRIVEAHGGVVAAANRPSGGAAFRVRLPMAAGPRPTSSGVRARSAALRDHSDREVF